MSEFQSPSETGESERSISRRNLLKPVTALALATMLIAGGCGQKGPLYLPETESDEEENKT